MLVTIFSFISEKSNNNQNLYIIDLTQFPKKDNPIKLTQFASKISYLPLESIKDYLIGVSPSFYLFDSIIVCRAHHQIFIFNSENGKFIKSIGEYGRGPDGFINSRSCYLKNEEIIINAIGWDYPLIEFSANGKILNKLKPERYPRDIAWLNNNLYAIYYQKNSLSDSIRLQIYDLNKNKVVSTFFDYRIYKDTRKVTNFGAFFYYYDSKLYIKEYFKDTIFLVTTEKLIPAIIFNSGKYSPPFYEKETFDHTEYYSINTILETENLIFFRLALKKRGYYCYYDKSTKKIMIPNYKDLQISAFENDIDGFMPFEPRTISSRNKLIGFLEAYKIKQWFEENSDKAAKLPPHLQKFRNIKEDDNPVIMIVTLK